MAPARKDEALDWDYKGTTGAYLLNSCLSSPHTHSVTACYPTHNKSADGLITLRAGSYR